MQNIKEVIGIIKGISFDNVINEKEVLYLQKWVELNKPLATLPNQKKLMKLIDEALEDKILTNDERRDLLFTADDVLKVQNDENTIFTELNGIIEGIISDGVLNDEEILKLLHWYKSHNEFIGKNNLECSIRDMVFNIIEDGVITNEERNELLNYLTEVINTLKVNVKLQVLKEKLNNHENIGIELIELLDQTENMTYIHDLAKKSLIRTLNSYSGKLYDTDIVIISLSLIAMLNYNGIFWDSVRKEYQSLYDVYTSQKIEGLIRSIISQYKTSEKMYSRSRIISFPLQQALVPKHFLSNYFEFIYDIYKLNFEYNLTGVDLFGEFRFVFDGLKSSFMNHGDEIKLNITKKTYKLIQSSKDLLGQDHSLEAMIKLSIMVVQIIDQYIWNKNPILHNTYLKFGFDKWKNTLESKEQIKRERNNNTWRSHWNPIYTLRDQGVVLVPPNHKVKSEYDYRTIKVVVKNGDEIIYEDNKPDIREIIGGYQINSKPIHIMNPLNELRYLLISNDRVIYDSKTLLHKKFLVFDEHNNEIENNTDYKGIAVLCTKDKVAHAEVFKKYPNYFLSTIKVKYGDTLFINSDIFSFTTLTKPGIFGEVLDGYSVSKENSSVEYKVYKEIKYLVFEDNDDVYDYVIVINGKRYSMDSFQCTRTSPRTGISKYVIDLNIHIPNIYEITVYRKTENNLLNINSFKIVYDPLISVSKQKVDDEKYLISVTTGLVDEDIISEIELRDFDMDAIRFQRLREKYVYYVPFGIELYRINDNWNSVNDDLWIDDVKADSKLELYGIDADAIMVYSSQGSLLEESLSLKAIKSNVSEISVGFLTSYKNEFDFVSIILIKDGKAVNQIRCNNKCIVEDVKLDFNAITSDLNVQIFYKGKPHVYFEVLNNENIKIYQSDVMVSSSIAVVSKLKSFENYTINIYEKINGLLIRKDKLLKTIIRQFYAQKDFEGKSFLIKEVCYMDKYSEKNASLKRTYLQFTKQTGVNQFIGNIFAHKIKGGIFWHKNLNPVEIEITSNEMSGECEVYVTNQKDGLLFDEKYNSILNDLDNKYAPDIELYVVDLKKQG